MLSNWFQTELPILLEEMANVPAEEAGLEEYEPDDCWCVSLVICLDCGHIWKACWTDGPGNEFLLDCPACEAYHSAPISNE